MADEKLVEGKEVDVDFFEIKKIADCTCDNCGEKFRITVAADEDKGIYTCECDGENGIAWIDYGLEIFSEHHFELKIQKIEYYVHVVESGGW